MLIFNLSINISWTRTSIQEFDKRVFLFKYIQNTRHQLARLQTILLWTAKNYYFLNSDAVFYSFFIPLVFRKYKKLLTQEK